MRIFLSLLALAALTACKATDLLTLGVSSDNFTVTKDIRYSDGDRNTLDVYQPTHPAPGHPVLVFFYGGEWRYGAKGDVKFVAEPLAEEGITVVVPDYRLSPEVTFPAFIQDGAAATAWTKAHIADYGGDPKALFVSGHSAGGYIAAMLALNPAYLEAAGMSRADLSGAIGLAGPYNFLPITWPELKPIFEVVPDMNVTQPIAFVDGHAPPMLLLAGADDDTVNPMENTDALYSAIREKKGDAHEILYPDLGHVGLVLAFSPQFQGNGPVLEDTARFIKDHTFTKGSATSKDVKQERN